MTVLTRVMGFIFDKISNCYLNMKIQIISKGEKRSPQCKHLKENSLNKVNRDLAKSSVPFYQEYYPPQKDRE